MKDEEEQEEATPGTAWPPRIQRQETGSASSRIARFTLGSSAWATVWAVSVVRTLSLWAYFLLDMWADDRGTYDMSAINSIGDKAFPEYFVVKLIIKLCKPTSDPLLLLWTLLVFLNTFVIAVLFCLVVVTGYLRHPNQAAQK